jgi:hypothetical protein
MPFGRNSKDFFRLFYKYFAPNGAKNRYVNRTQPAYAFSRREIIHRSSKHRRWLVRVHDRN